MNSKDRYIFIAIMLFLGLSLFVELIYFRSTSKDVNVVVTNSGEVDSRTQVPNEAFEREVVYTKGGQNLSGYLCKPKGQGPFPAVVYNHGGEGGSIGGAPRETCDFLARSNFVGFSPIRRKDKDLDKNLTDVKTAVDYVKRLAYVDKDHIGIMGFSRGGLLTYMVAAEKEFVAQIIMASAPPGKVELDKLAKKFSSPTLLLVSKNDTSKNNSEKQDHLAVAKQMKSAIETAEKEVELIIYPPYKENGHLMFFEIGDYWDDVLKFLTKNLKK